ncbi:immunoglobulin-like domain-containing protein, partial [Clostridium tertium]|uniref:immunoglobulin-like domain-containing protein n=1 Tax=Clostridium tertium TaxID=1559 RepID=UPI00374F1241
WYKDVDCTIPWDFDTDKMPSNNLTLYAKWNIRTVIINKVPTITASDKVLTLGDNFDPLAEVAAYDEEDGEITLTNANVIANNVDISKVGIYTVTYKVTDKDGASITKTITVVVNPKIEPINKVPTITASDKVLTLGDNFDPLAEVTAYDEEDGEITLTNANVIANNVDISKVGIYTVTYKVTDKDGASITKTITVVVNPKIEPINKVPTITASDKV